MHQSADRQWGSELLDLFLVTVRYMRRKTAKDYGVGINQDIF